MNHNNSNLIYIILLVVLRFCKYDCFVQVFRRISHAKPRRSWQEMGYPTSFKTRAMPSMPYGVFRKPRYLLCSKEASFSAFPGAFACFFNTNRWSFKARKADYATYLLYFHRWEFYMFKYMCLVLRKSISLRTCFVIFCFSLWERWGQWCRPFHRRYQK